MSYAEPFAHLLCLFLYKRLSRGWQMKMTGPRFHVGFEARWEDPHANASDKNLT